MIRTPKGTLIWGFPKIGGTSLGSFFYGNPTIWGSIIGVPYFRKLPVREITKLQSLRRLHPGSRLLASPPSLKRPKEVSSLKPGPFWGYYV